MTEGEKQSVTDLVLALRDITAKVRDLAVKGDGRTALEERSRLAAELAKELARVLGIERPELTAVEAAESAAADAIVKGTKEVTDPASPGKAGKREGLYTLARP